MNTPKAHSKFDKFTKKPQPKYATVNNEDGVQYQTIATIMSQLGEPMAPSSARNTLIRGSKHVVQKVWRAFRGVDLDDRAAVRIALSPEFQTALASSMDAIDNALPESRTK